VKRFSSLVSQAEKHQTEKTGGLMKDLKSLDTVYLAEEGIPFKPLDFDGNEIGCTFFLRGIDSRQLARAQDRKTREYSKNVFAGATGRKPEDDFVTTDADIQFCCEAFLSWKEVIWDGKELAYTSENVRMLMTQVPFLREQVSRFVAERKNFKPPVPNK